MIKITLICGLWANGSPELRLESRGVGEPLGPPKALTAPIPQPLFFGWLRLHLEQDLPCSFSREMASALHFHKREKE